MTPSPQLIREEIVEIIKESVSSGRIFEMQKLLSRPSPAPKYLISEKELDDMIKFVNDPHTIYQALCEIKSRPSPAPTSPQFNSTELLLLANDEWKRREERRHIHKCVPWSVGFINGFLTDKKWAREYLDKLLKVQHP